MIDSEMKSQLQEVFGKLERPVKLVYDESDHQNQHELIEMLEDLRSTSSKILVESSGQSSPSPSFHIERESKATGLRFRGIPGGHEFTSLIVAILNTDGKGKMPDSGLRARIRALNGPIRLQTFISLTCENCPDVVQALNQMALVHSDFVHEMVDGAYAESEIAALSIQGVPSVVSEGKLIHSGRIHFLDLLAKLEAHFGTREIAGDEVQGESHQLGDFDVAVIGGGPAGVTAAIYSVRKGLKTALLAERIGGQVQDTKGIENLISVVYTEGPQLAEDLYKHLASYPVTVFDRRRVKTLSRDRKILLEGGESLSAQSVIIASGAKWRELGVPGEKEYIGRGVAYCPHCDGPFYKGKKIIVVGGGNSGVEAAIDLAAIAGEVKLLEFGETLKADQILIDKLKSLSNTSIITGAKTTELTGNGKKIVSLKYVDRKTDKNVDLEVDGVFIQIGLIPNSAFAKGAVELSKFGEVVVDEKCHTSVPGIYAAGDVTTVPYKQIVIAMGEGAKAALAAFEDRTYGRKG
ncbi:MAG: alkyl hydroperoxide reductase subunit F [Bdellovibrio sp.]|nr:MAG: alkyl hydroperoxide reductase subunit F [Bdellovibrio sp.]